MNCCPESRGLARRSLLKGLAAGVGLAVVDGPVPGTRYAFGASSPYVGDTLVVLSLRGGFDGLNAIVPVGDPAYLAARPSIGLPERVLIPAGGIFGLHPALAPLKPFWDDGTFGAVHAVGQVNPTRSHFQAMTELERAAPGSSVRTGWLDRTLGLRAPGSVFQGAQVGSTETPLSLSGPAPELTLHTLKDFDVNGAWDATERARWTTALRALHADAPEVIAGPARAALGAVTTAAAITAQTDPAANGAQYPDSTLGAALRDVARLMKQGVGLQVACVDDGDWDMHAGVGAPDDGWMHDNLTDLAQALAAFATDLGSLLGGVTLVTLSEFGRRVGENASGGVDHGHGNAVLLLGGGVAGGKVHGRWPGLDDAHLVDGDLAGTTDHRALLAEILAVRCGQSDVTQIFPGLGPTKPLGIVRHRP
jgi:uncharacterized protein (DUF1501 family)